LIRLVWRVVVMPVGLLGIVFCPAAIAQAITWTAKKPVVVYKTREMPDCVGRVGSIRRHGGLDAARRAGNFYW
jgi:hypothetical protein